MRFDTHNWIRALHLRDELATFLNNSAGQAFMMGFKDVDPDKGRTLKWLELMPASMPNAVPYSVCSSVVDVLEAAAPVMPMEPLMPEDLHSISGFAHFERPIRFHHGGGFNEPCCGVWWNHITSPGGDGIATGFLFDAATIVGDTGERLIDVLPSNISSILPMWGSLIHFGTDINALLAREMVGQGINDLSTEQALYPYQILRALWSFCRDKITEVTPSEAPRSDRRRAEKEGRPAPPRVNVVTLRRVRRPTENPGEHPVEWSHRWLVTGHWRNQWYPSIKAHRQRWIAGYVKGPDDKPVLAKTKVFEVSR